MSLVTLNSEIQGFDVDHLGNDVIFHRRKLTDSIPEVEPCS